MLIMHLSATRSNCVLWEAQRDASVKSRASQNGCLDLCSETKSKLIADRHRVREGWEENRYKLLILGSSQLHLDQSYPLASHFTKSGCRNHAKGTERLLSPLICMAEPRRLMRWRGRLLVFRFRSTKRESWRSVVGPLDLRKSLWVATPL